MHILHIGAPYCPAKIKAVRSVDFLVKSAALYFYEVLFYILITGGFFFDFYVPFCLILPYTRPLTLDIPL